jgi:hypothetical protein
MTVRDLLFYFYRGSAPSPNKLDFIHGTQFLTIFPGDLAADLLFRSIEALSSFPVIPRWNIGP